MRLRFLHTHRAAAIVVLSVVVVCALIVASYAGAAITIQDSVTTGGDVYVAGTISKGSGTFVIDHPLDPANKLLYHSFVESPEAKNIYDGIATLNEDGEATIELPSYFMALNTDFRYLVSSVDGPQPNLYLKEEAHPRYFGLFGRPVFKVAGGESGGRVSWQVSGARRDPYIRENPIVPEVDKDETTLVDKGEFIFEGYVPTTTAPTTP